MRQPKLAHVFGFFDYGAQTRSCFFTSSMPSEQSGIDIHETGEIKRVVTSLLMQIDESPSYTIVAGATNRPELLERATDGF
jgi:hypothetical protein